MTEYLKGRVNQALLSDKVQRLALRDSLDPVIARTTVRKLASSLGYNLIAQVRIATAIFEIAHRIVSYTGQGEIVINWREDNPQRKGLEFFCNDQGRCAPQLTTFLQTGNDVMVDKLNLLSLKQLVDEFEATTDPNYGNCVMFTIWLK